MKRATVKQRLREVAIWGTLIPKSVNYDSYPLILAAVIYKHFTNILE